MRSDDIVGAVGSVGKKWTRQIKAEERHSSARRYRREVWTTPTRTSLKDICYERMSDAWAQASDGGRLPTHWRQVFYVMRPICDEHPDSDRALRDSTFKNILESYLEDHRPGWDVLRGARGVFKEPFAAENDNGLAMSTMNVRGYLAAGPPTPELVELASRYPTKGARNRIAAALICEKEGFDELLQAERIPERYDLALVSTKGISAIAARDLVRGLHVPCFTLHDLDKNGFVMAAGFPFATDIGIRLVDVEKWGLEPEEQRHPNPAKTRSNLLCNGATGEEAAFIAGGQRVELNMFTSRDFIAFVEEKLSEHEVTKVVPDADTLAAAWRRAHQVIRVNAFIRSTRDETHETPDLDVSIPSPPADLADRIRDSFEKDAARSWDSVLWDLAEDGWGAPA